MSNDWRQYEFRTRRHYQNVEVARRYAEGYCGPLTLRRIPTKVIAAREVFCVAAALRRCGHGMRRVLDVPCGTGKLSALLCSHAGELLVGCDISAEMLSIARDPNARAGKKKVLFARADATALPYPDASFDCVVCLRLLHRIPPPIRLAIVKELARVSSHYLIVSFARETTWQKFRMRIRRFLTKSESCAFPASKEEISTLSALGGMVAKKAWSVLPVLSGGVVMLLEKPGPWSHGSSPHEPGA
jgi:SAM-dependent methyltransferase